MMRRFISVVLVAIIAHLLIIGISIITCKILNINYNDAIPGIMLADVAGTAFITALFVTIGDT